MKAITVLIFSVFLAITSACSSGGNDNNPPANNTPLADAQTVTTIEDISLPIILTASDADGDILSYSIVSFPLNGSLTGTPPNITYTPDNNFYGGDSFTFIVNDGSLDSLAASVSIDILPVNDAVPVASDDSIDLFPGDTVTGTLVATDIDADELSFSIVSYPANGSLLLTDASTGAFSYTLNSNASSDSFTFIANDGYGDSNIATVTITGLAPGSSPTALSAVAYDQRVTLNWNAVAGASSYVVYVSTTSGQATGGTAISGVVPPYHHNGLTNGIEYFYAVSAVNAAGESPATSEVSAIPFDVLISGLYFFDTQLAACISTATSAMTYVHELTTLNCSNMGIFSLSGLENLTSLVSLNLGTNNINDVSSLANLTNLTYLDLKSNVINDISSLASLNKLNTLYLQDGYNAVSDLSALAKMTELVTLNLSSNNVSDISPLSELIKLTMLRLGSNNISDVSALQNLSSLTVLDLSHNSIGDISALSGLINLTYLNIAYGSNHISDITTLTGMTKLFSLWLNDNNISDLSSLAIMNSLDSLHIGGNNISDVTPLAGLPNLRLLSLNNNLIVDVSALSGISSLRYLNLAHNNSLDITSLADITQLTTLDLSYGYYITNVSPLASLLNLQSLNLMFNSIVDVSPLASLTTLNTLTLSYNEIGGQGIGNVDTLTALTSASSINLSNNIGMSCSELDSLISTLGSPPVNYSTASDGVNCSNP